MSQEYVEACVYWFLAAALVVVIVIISGCAGSFDGVCGAIPLGQNEQGVAFLRVHCEAAK